MGWVVGLGSAIWSALAAAAAAAASAAAVAAMAVYHALIVAGSFIYSAAAGLVVGVAEGLGIITSATSTSLMSSIGAMNAVGSVVYSTTAYYVGAVVGAFKGFLEVIHFKTLYQIHKIAYVLSSDYRKLMQKIYGQLSDFSYAVGLGAQFVTLALRNARNVVLDVTAMFGRGYDLGEVTWLTEMSNFFSAVNDKTNAIVKNPYYLLDLIDANIYKPMLDNKGSLMAGLFNTIDNSLEIIDDFLEKATTLNKDLEKMWNQLPSQIKQQLYAFRKDVIDPINEFIDSTYLKDYEKVKEVMAIIDTRVSEQRVEIDGVVKRLKKPGDLLSSIIGLRSEEREAQRQLMFETVNKPLYEGSLGAIEAADEESGKLQVIIDALETSLPEPEYTVPEIDAPKSKKTGSKDPSNDWNVGDY